MSEVNGLGKIHVITGPGKGKTTAAFGSAIRAAGHGIRVGIVQFMKADGSGEVISARHLDNIEVMQFGTGNFIDFGQAREHDIAKAGEGLRQAEKFLTSGDYGLVILDEISVAVDFGLLNADEVLAVIRSRKSGVEVILTGRNVPKSFVSEADYVSFIQSVKHPFDKGDEARRGVEW